PPPAHLRSLPLSSILPRPPPSTPFPYTTLFRSCLRASYTASATLLLRFSERISRTLRPAFGTCLHAHSGSFLPVSFPTVSSPVKDRKSTRLNSSHVSISYAVFCLKKKIESQHLT